MKAYVAHPPLNSIKPAFVAALDRAAREGLNLYQMVDLALKHGLIDDKIKGEMQAANTAFYNAMFGRE